MKYLGENDEVWSLQQEDGRSFNVAKNSTNPETLKMIQELKGQSSSVPEYAQVPADMTGIQIPENIKALPQTPVQAQTDFNSFQNANNQGTAVEVANTPSLAPRQIPSPPDFANQDFTAPQGSGPEFRVIPGQMEQKQIQTSTSTSTLDKEGQAARSNIDRITEQQQKALDNQANAMVTANDTVTTAIQTQQQKNAENQAIIQKKEADRLAALEAGLSQYETATMAARREESRDFFDNNSRVVSGIAVALGALGSAFAGGPNHAMNVIQMRLQSDLETQKRKANGIREDANNSYKRLREKLGDERLADEAWLRSAYEQTAGQVDVVTRQMKNPEIIANKDVLRQGLLGKANELKITSADRIQNNITATSAKADDKVVGRDGVPIKENFKNGKELIDAVKDDKDIQEMRSKKAALGQYQSLVKENATAAAKSAFIANYLKQGSYSPDFDKLLNENGIVDKSVEGIRKFFAGGADPAMIKRFDSAMEKELSSFQGTLKAKMDMYANAARQFRFDPDAIIPGYSEFSAQKQPSALGFTPRK